MDPLGREGWNKHRESEKADCAVKSYKVSEKLRRENGRKGEQDEKDRDKMKRKTGKAD